MASKITDKSVQPRGLDGHRNGKRRPHVAVFLSAAGSYGRGLLKGIAAYLMEAHAPWSLFVEPRASGQFDPAWLRLWKGDGVLAYIEDKAVAKRLRQLRIPVVETYGDVQDLGLPSVGNDDLAIGRSAAEHLLALRFPYLGYSGYPHDRWARLREEGFCNAARNAGRPCEVHHHSRSFTTLASWEQAQNDLMTWLQRLPKPLGVMACSDRHAQKILDACRRADIVVPDEVAVIGVDNDEIICSLSSPTLSSVRDSSVQIGFEAARLLDALMKGEISRANIAEPRLFPPQGVVARGSTEILIVDDDMVAEGLRFIRDRACSGIGVDNVVKYLGYSRSAIYQRFRKAIGRSPHEQILQTRLLRVRALLTETSMSVESIARTTGFEYPEYMGALFRRRLGMTPGEYRKKFQSLLPR